MVKIIKNNSIIFFLFLTLNGFSQNPIISGVISSDKDSAVGIKDVIVSSNNIGVFSIIEYYEQERTIFIAKMVDSLNNFDGKKLPFFLSQCDLDYIYCSLWNNTHNSNSLRQLIFARITNKKCLRAIIKSKIKDYSKTSNQRTHFYGENKISFQDESNVALAKQQLKILMAIK